MMRKYLSIAISIIAFFAFQSASLAQGPCTWSSFPATDVMHAVTISKDNLDPSQDRTGEQFVTGTDLPRNYYYSMPVPPGAVSFSADLKMGASSGSINQYANIYEWNAMYLPSESVLRTTVHFVEKDVWIHIQVDNITMQWLALKVPDYSVTTFIRNAQWGYACGGGPGPACPTVTDYDFNRAYVPASYDDPWLTPFSDGNDGIIYALTPISGDGAASLGAYNLIAQRMTITKTNKYTVTFSARAVSAEILGYLDVGLSSSMSAVAEYNSSGLSYDVLPTASRDALVSQIIPITSTTYAVYTATFNTDNSSVLFLDVPKRPAGETGSIDVDWVCVEASDNTTTCQNPHAVQFPFDHGTDTASEGWSAVDYAVLDPLSQKNNMLPRWGLLNSMYDMFPGFYVSSGAFGFNTNDVTAIQYDDVVIPSAITTTVVYPKDVDMKLDLFLNDGNGWYVADTAFMYNSGTVFGEFITQTIAFTLPSIYDATPYNVALAMTVNSSSLTDIGFRRMGFDDVTLSGCFAGDPAAGGCILNDPELDQADGSPNELYWFGSFSPETGSAFLDAGGVLAQNIAPPRAGAYQLQMLASTFVSQYCDFTVQIRDYNSTTVIGEYPVQCKSGLMQNYTLGIQLPDTPVEFSIHQNNGSMQIDSLCITSPNEPVCLNKNPVFVSGATNYGGDFTIADGAAVLQPGASIYATGVPLGGDKSYQLQVTASPVETGTVRAVISDDTLPPTVSSPGVTISGTQSITHTFTANADVAGLGRGPYVWNWNNPYESALRVTNYCVTEITSTVYYGGKQCSTIENSDFDNGLQGWTANNVTGVGGYAVFGGTGGSLLSTVVNVSEVMENLITNPSFEVDTSGWVVYNGSGSDVSVSRDNTTAVNGSASAKIEKTVAINNSQFYTIFSQSDTNIDTYSVKITAKSSSPTTAYLRLKNADSPYTQYAYSTISLTPDWQTFEMSGVVTDIGVNLALRLYLTDDDSTIWVDDVQVTKTATQQTYHDGDDPWCNWTGTPHASTTKCGFPFDATVHIIGKAPTTTPVNATVTISSTGSTTTTTHTFGYGMTGDEYFDNYQVGGGDMQVSINADAGFELDYICVIPGKFTEPGEPGTGGGIDIGSGHCAPPPMSILNDLPLSGWLDGIWIWDSATPSNAEIVQAYSAGWLRYIGCTQTEIGQMVEEKLDTIIKRLNALIALQGVDALASVISAISDSISLLEQSINDLIDTLVSDGVSIAAILGALLLFFGALMGVISLIIGLLYLFWMIPQEFWTSMWGSIRGSDAVLLPLPQSPSDPLYNIYVGFQLFNSTIAPTWLFTITVIVIALGSISLIWWTVNRIQIKW